MTGDDINNKDADTIQHTGNDGLYNVILHEKLQSIGLKIHTFLEKTTSNCTCLITRIVIFLRPQKKQSVMVEATKLLYESPTTDVVELTIDSFILQASGGEYPGWNEQNI